MRTPAKQERIEVIDKIRKTQYNLENLDGYIDQLLERSMAKCSEEDDEYLAANFGQMAYGIMRVWYMAREIDKQLTKGYEHP